MCPKCSLLLKQFQCIRRPRKAWGNQNKTTWGLLCCCV
jgi:hypothetical protein